MIDRNSTIPLYYQIKEELLAEIQQGGRKIGELIPSEHQLAEKYKVSRYTAQRAINELVNDGVLSRRQGFGTFVATPKIEQSLSGFYSFSQALGSQGIPTSTKVISMTKNLSTLDQAKFLAINPGEEVYSLRRIRYANNTPIMIDASIIPAMLTPDLEKIDFENNSLYAVLEQKYGLCVTRAKEMFEPTTTSFEESKFLEVSENSPAILLDRIAYTAHDIPVEYCKSIVAGDKCRFYSELR